MKLSPLQLVRYLMSDISCIANPGYDSERPRGWSDESFVAESRIHSLKSEAKEKYTSWSVELDLCQRSDETVNVPYHFQVKLVGLFRCSKAPADIPSEVFVKTNGSSILYGIARELLRGLTAVGPWGQLLLPTISFNSDSSPPTQAVKKIKAVKSATKRARKQAK